MPDASRFIEQVIHDDKAHGLRRFTQDSPIYPDVWWAFADGGLEKRIDLLLAPQRDYSVGDLQLALRTRLQQTADTTDEPPPWRLSNNGAAIAAELTIGELVRSALPLTEWWRDYVWREGESSSPDLMWLHRVLSAVLAAAVLNSDSGMTDKDWDQQLDAIRKGEAKECEEAWRRIEEADPDPQDAPCLWSVSLNRKAHCQLNRSVPSTKADAARRLFDIDGAGITWAVIDSGIDARHVAFRTSHPKTDPPQRFDHPFEPIGNRWRNQTRIVQTLDFTRLRELASGVEGIIAAAGAPAKKRALDHLQKDAPDAGHATGRVMSKKERADLIRDMERAATRGRMLDWSVVAPLLRVPDEKYDPPANSHGTHVAGILGAGYRPTEFENPPLAKAIHGMCPGISMYDLRVFDDQGYGDEFAILAALQYVRWINAQSDELVIHGVNLSLSIKHNVANFACGRTPICEECQRLIAEGVVVVAAAGNRGRARYVTVDDSFDDGFRTVSITDPGNAEAVITVGATHRFKPHTYGVSYFSSRGPTGDGRAKPDLLAPGEKIRSTAPNDRAETMDGTSQAAPHVSGAAALLLAEHREMIGQPARVKKALCDTATDLGRERYFQGHGVLDALRALQSI